MFTVRVYPEQACGGAGAEAGGAWCVAGKWCAVTQKPDEATNVQPSAGTRGPLCLHIMFSFVRLPPPSDDLAQCAAAAGVMARERR